MAKLFITLSSIISLIRDFISRMVTILRFDHMIGDNQQFNDSTLTSYIVLIQIDNVSCQN